jgi:transcriptional regulator with XRE-family HTH domain
MKVKKKNRRSDIKTLTREGQTLKYFRESRRLSMRKAGRIIGVSEATVNHLENGRMDVTGDFIKRFLNAYGYSADEFNLYVAGRLEIPESNLAECIAIIKRLDPAKLKTVKTILQSF